MFGIDSAELLIIALVALVVIGPKDLPRAMRTIGNWVGRARGMARHFRAGMDTMIRESELEDMEKVWKSNNDRIMRAHPTPPESDWGATQPAPADGNAPAATPALAPPADLSRPKPPPAPPRRSRAKAPAAPAPVAPPSDEPA